MSTNLHQVHKAKHLKKIHINTTISCPHYLKPFSFGPCMFKVTYNKLMGNSSYPGNLGLENLLKWGTIMWKLIFVKGRLNFLSLQLGYYFFKQFSQASIFDEQIYRSQFSTTHSHNRKTPLVICLRDHSY